MVLDKSLNMEPKRIRLESSQVPLRPLQIQNNPQAASQHSSRSIQVPLYPAGTMVNGNNNSNLQPGRIFVSANVRVRNPTMENTRDQRIHGPPSHNQINLAAGGMGVALGNTMTGAVVSQSGHLQNSMRHNPQHQQQSQVTLPSYNLHPMPPVFSNNVVRLPANMTGVGGVTQNITVPSVEVRIGSRKFKTTSGVCFKDDGVLFTLKDYSYAPVLLNARAILKCKANLNIVGYPVIFLFLETSCMKQIRNIFAISEEEFSHHSPVELLRYITIFPTYGPEHKGQSQLIMQSIKKSFDLMLKRFPRPNSVLEEITNEQCIDILYSSFNNSEPSTGAAMVRQNIAEEVEPRSSVTPSVAPMTQSSTAASPMNHQIRNDLLQQRSPSQQPSTENFINAAVPLNVPSDQELWRQMQKDLTVGGVYHVMMPNGRKTYCLWNGTQLMSCLVQNTEVQMTCSHARFGMTLLKCIGQVRVKADQTTGLYFTVRNTKKELTEICIQPVDIVKMQIFFHSVNSSIIVSVTPECSSRLSESAQLFGESSSLVRRTFDSASGDPSRSYLVLFIQQLHKDQEEALLQMKYGITTHHIKKGSQMFESVDLQVATSFLCEIATGSSDAGKRYETSNNMSGLQGYEKLVKTFLQRESLILPPVNAIHPSSVTAVDDDDDDDIIMTQQELGTKCPYTQQVMKNPVTNKKCRHNYEKDAIFEFIAIKKGNARCPYAGCANLDPLTAVDLENNESLREYIEMKQRS